MANVWRLTMLMVGLIFMGRDQVCSAGDVEEMNERLSSLEAGQNRLQEFLQSLEYTHDHEAQDAMVFAQDIQQSVEGQREMMQNIQQLLEDRKNNGGQRNNSSGGAAMTGPCLPGNHTTIDDERRAINGEYDGYEDMCDNDLQPGWYRFLLEGCGAVIPTACVPENHCHTDAPTWVDLQGQSLPEVGQEVDARACSHWSGDCCNWQSDITVRNCGEYFVYKIEPLSTCDLSFCVKAQF